MDKQLDRQTWLEKAMTQYEECLLHICFVNLGDVALAEDAVQETFLKAYRSLSGFRNEANEKTWLIRIAINTCRDMHRSAWFRHVDMSTSLEQLNELSIPASDPDNTLVEAIMKLKPKYREVILLCCYQELTGQEAADVLRISRSAVMSRLKKAKGLLKEELEAWYYEG